MRDNDFSQATWHKRRRAIGETGSEAKIRMFQIADSRFESNICRLSSLHIIDHSFDRS